MKTIINLLAGIMFLVTLNVSFANDINYKLTTNNISYTSDKSLEFDIYLMSSSETKDEWRYAAGQYFLDCQESTAQLHTSIRL